jgi:hypothetical protein
LLRKKERVQRQDGEGLLLVKEVRVEVGLSQEWTGKESLKL